MPQVQPPVIKVQQIPPHIEEAERKTQNWFAARKICPTLHEYREVWVCMRKGLNPLGIH